MEGHLALKTPNLFKRLPALCAIMFGLGAGLEYVMCKTGFYNVTAVKEGQKVASEKAEEEEFWMRVKARRAAREAQVTIRSEE
mmetsp:Transcript_38163/g.75688  ORF Transcript_38163/g.75688 Transcript_38163/m.75688 type:complete len:83 (-) Transcript_38163:85-333(-)